MVLKIIFTSDIHGCLFPYDFIHGKEATVSLSQVSSFIKKARVENPDSVILLDGGDVLQGQPSCFISNLRNGKEINLAARIYNYLHYDVICIGNHDIETGHAVYDKWAEETDSPILSANIVDAKTFRPYFNPYTIVERQGVRVAVLGLTTTAIPYWLPKRLWEGMIFQDTIESAKHWVDYLRNVERADLIIGLFHSGFNGGIDSGINIENFTERVAKQVKGFDLILFGHDHKTFCGTILSVDGKEVTCVNPSSNAYFVGDIEVGFEKIESNVKEERVVCWKKGKINANLLNVEKLPVDEDFLSVFQKDMIGVKKLMEVSIGNLTDTMYTRDSCFGCGTIDRLIHKVQLSVSGAQVSFAAPLCFDETFIPGEILVRDLFRMYQYENTITALYMTGQEIKDYLEMSYGLWINTMRVGEKHIMQLEQFMLNGTQYSFFKNLVFNFDTAAGFYYIVDVTREMGQRISIKNFENGKSFSLKERYLVAMHSYRACGGNNFLTLGAHIPHDELPNRIVYESKESERYYLYKYIKRCGELKAEVADNWKFVPEDIANSTIKHDRKLLFPNS